MNMAQLMTVRLGRHDAQPWGFRLQGGKDFGTPLVVQKVNGGSIAEQAGLIPGDAVLKINNVDVFNLRHKDAQDIIVRSGNTFEITIQRGGSTWRPQVTPIGQVPSAGYGNSIPTVTKTSLAHRPQEVRHIGSGYNNAARPFSSVNGSDGQVKSIVNKQYNTPVGIYSEEAIAETLSAQAEVLAGGVLGVNFKKNEKVYNAANSEVYKFLHEQDQGEPAERPPHFVEHNPQQHYETPQQQYQQHQQSQQHQQHQQHQQQQQSANHQPAVTRHVMAPVNQPKAPSTGGLPTGQNICANCERLIVGVFVRIKDKNLHVDCFKCATCGTSLKNQGYYNFNNKLYCDIHAKLAAMNNPPPGTEGYMPVPIKPCAKLSANTISAAINAHHHQSNGTSHLIGSPTSNANQQDQTPPPFQPSHSRTSSSSSVGTTNSCISSLSPNISSTPEKLSPVHSRQSSGSGSLLSGPGSGSGSAGLQQLKGISVPPISFGTMSSTGESIIYKQNENDMNSNNRSMTSNGAPGGTESGTSQTSAYNQFLKKYSDTVNGGNKSSFGDINGSNSAANVTLTGVPGYGHQEATPTESLYGSIRADTKIQPNDEFQYVTLDGSVIKSVIPPGKGIKTNYKVNQGYGGPKPFNMSPKTPPISGPKSPSTYPPPSQGSSWGQPKPAVNPYATLPRSTGQSQGTGTEHDVDELFSEVNVMYDPERIEKEQIEQSYEYQKEEDLEVSQATQASATVSNVIWPPPHEDYRLTPTATPLYIAPPETQHVKPKYIEKVEHRESRQTEKQQSTHQETREQTKTTISAEERREMQQHEMQVYQQQQYEQQQYQQQQALQWQSRSAPELTVGKQQVDVESSSDSYTSTCTTTTTTSEEYQRMYQAQVQAYQMQQMFEQSGSEMDYHMDMEVAAMQQQQEQSYSTSSDFLSAHSGRRSAQECAETIRGPVSTYKLIDLVREVTPSPTPPSGKGPRKVEFKEDIEEKEESAVKIEKTEAKAQKKEVKIKEEKDEEISEAVFEKVEIERKFPPAPEIKIEIPEPKPVPPSNIPNPVPKEWISLMQKALTTAPEKPVVLSDICSSCPCEEPCKAAECKCKKEAEKREEKHKEEKEKEVSKEEIAEEKPEVLTETPPKGSFIARVVSTAPTDPVQFAPKSSEPIPLPEETEPYMPPPMDMKPYIREDFRPKSPLLRALTTAPEEPFSPLGEGVASQLDDLPRPKGRLTMVDALTVAPDRSYSPLNPENILSFTEKNEDKKTSLCKRDSLKEQTIQKSVDVSVGVDQTQASSAFASFSGQSSISSFQPRLEPIAYTPSQSSVQTTSISGQAQDAHYTSYSSHSSLAQKQQQQQSMFQTSSSFQSSQQSQTQVSSTTQIQKTTCAKSECHKQTTCAKSECHKKQHAQEKTQVVSFPPEPGMPAKKAVLSGLHKPETIPQYQRNWTVLPSQRPVRTPEPPELKENVPLAFVDVSREQSPNIEKPQAVKTPASSSISGPSSAGAAVSNATRSSETKPKMQPPTVPIIIEDRTGPITMTFQSIDDPSEQHHDDHSYAHPRPFTPSIINRAPPIVPFYQTAENLVFEECPATTSHPFDRRSVSPLPERAKSPAPGPPPNPLNAIRAPRIKEDDLVPARVPQVGSITTGQPYLGGQLMQQHQQQGQVLSHYQTVSQAGSHSFVDKPEVVQQSRIGDMQVERREKESHLSEEQQSKLESKTTTQIGNTQIERRRKVVEEFEHTQKAKTVEIRKSSGGTTQQTHQYGRTGFVANQTSRLSGLENEISSLTSQAQAISARAATLGQSESSKFPQFQSPEPLSKFPISSPLHSYGEPEKQESFISGNSVHQYAAQETQSAAATSSSSYAASSLSQSSASHSFLGSSNISAGSASNYASAIPVPAFKPPLFSAGGGGAATDKSAVTSSNNTYQPTPSTGPAGFKPPPPVQPSNINPSSNASDPSPASTGGAGPGAGKGGAFGATSAPKRGRGILNKAVGPGARIPLCGCCNAQVSCLSMSNSLLFCLLCVYPDDTNIPVPPPPPLPTQPPKANGFNSLRRVNCEGGQRLGKATEMLASSLERLDINTKDNFKVEAGKILSSMLEARLSGKTSPRPPPQLPPQPVEIAPHPMKSVIDMCDASLQNKNPPLPADTVKQLQAKVEPVPIDPIKQIKDRDNLVSSPANGKVQELEPLETVIYRNKSTNPNAKRELTSHALDRRSYIEKDQQSFEQDNSPEIVAKVGNDVQPEKIASELSDGKHPICCQCNAPIMRGPFITALGRIWCPEHFVCVNANCRRPLQDIGFVEEKGDLYCEYCFEKYLAPSCSKCNAKIKGDCLNAIGKHFHPECFTCSYCGKLFGNSPFFLEEGEPYCEADWNELFTTKCFACGFPVEAGDRWVEALNHNYHSQCFNCTMCKKNLEGQSFYNKGGRPFCKNHAR